MKGFYAATEIHLSITISNPLILVKMGALVKWKISYVKHVFKQEFHTGLSEDRTIKTVIKNCDEKNRAGSSNEMGSIQY